MLAWSFLYAGAAAVTSTATLHQSFRKKSARVACFRSFSTRDPGSRLQVQGCQCNCTCMLVLLISKRLAAERDRNLERCMSPPLILQVGTPSCVACVRLPAQHAANRFALLRWHVHCGADCKSMCTPYCTSTQRTGIPLLQHLWQALLFSRGESQTASWCNHYQSHG